MKLNWIFFLALFSVISVNGQYFQGKIIYELNYKSKVPSISDERFNEMMGTKQKFFIKNGNYKSFSNGTEVSWQLYVNKDSRLYNKFVDSDTAIWIDAKMNSDSIQKVEFNKNVTIIEGYKCDEIVFFCKNGLQKYYFNSFLTIDISLFKGHLLGNWYEYLKLAKALPLKSLIETPNCIIESTAVEIHKMDLSDDFFELPKNLETVESTY